MNSHRSGFAIIEVLVAIAILSLAGVQLIGLLGQSIDALHRATSVERTAFRVSEVMTRVSTWTRSQLDFNLGSSEIDGLALTVVTNAADLYEVRLVDEQNGFALSTSFYRPTDVR